MVYEAPTRAAAALYSPELLVAVAAAEDAVARLDERLARSPLRDGFNARAHFHDACASLSLAGAFVPLEDLILHDAEMDLRAPTHELTRAHAVLRARRRIAAAAPGVWLACGLDALRTGPDRQDVGQEKGKETAPIEVPLPSSDNPLVAAFAAIDAAIERSSRMLANSLDASPQIQKTARTETSRTLIYDSDHDEQALFAQWLSQVEATSCLPPTFAAALALDNWVELSPYERNSWLGAQFVADLLRSRSKALAHLPCVNVGLRALPKEGRRHKERDTRLRATLAALKAAAHWGLAEHDRLVAARARLERRCRGRREHSRLPMLADLVVAKPFVTANMAAVELKVSARAARDMMAALDLRELTGRGRFRAWGI
jgi:hypothetical protein